MNDQQPPEQDILQWDVKNWSRALRFWNEHIQPGRPARCLELGAREGGLSLWLALQGKQVLCSDYANTASVAQPLHRKYNVDQQILYQDIDATAIPYENEFDIIVFKSVIGGIGHGSAEVQKQVFSQIYKALKPAGMLLFAENMQASAAHGFFRKKFTRWSDYWRYPTLDEMHGYLSDYSSYTIRTTGVLGTFGRSEQQKSVLASIDRNLLNYICPPSWKYIAYGIATR